MAEFLGGESDVVWHRTTIYVDSKTKEKLKKNIKRLGCSGSWLICHLINSKSDDVLPERTNAPPNIADHVPRRSG